MHSADQPPTVPGLVLGDVLGRGAGGPVWSAVGAAGEPRAVKILPVPRHAAIGADEARLEVAAASFEHEHVVAVHDVVPCVVDGQPAIALVMERLDGGSLGSVLTERGRLSAGEVVTVVAPVASALAALHARGIVHGDVSPGNVLLAATGKPALADLGVARLVGDARVEVAGTDGVLAPEVDYGALPSPASDVHALGALAWWCLTGSAPGSALVRRPLAEQVAGRVPAALVDVVEAAVSPLPEDRPTALELATAIFEAAPAEPLRITPGGTEATALTRRIRAAHVPLAAGPPAEEEGPRLRIRLARPRRRLPRLRLPMPGIRWPRPALPRLRMRRPDIAWAPVAVAATAVLLTILALVALATGVLPTPERASAAPRSPASPASRATGDTASPRAAATTTPSPRASAPAGTEGPAVTAGPARTAATPTARPPTVVPLLERTDAATRDPRGVVAALLAARARLWDAPDLDASLRPAALATVHAAGSRSGADDARLLTQARDAGFHYTGVGFVIRSARVVTAGTVVRISASLDATAYVVTAADGATERRPTRLAQPVDVVVVRTGTGWRLADLTLGR